MSDGFGGSNRRLELVEVIHRVRNRWRIRLAIRGAVFVVAGTLLALFLSASSLQALRFSAASIIGFRVIALGVFGALVWFGLFLPLRRRVTDAQVARYLEERDPTLQEAIMSAVDSASHQHLGEEHGPSPRLVQKLVDQAIERCERIDAGMGVETEWVRRHAMALGGVALAALLLLVFGPAFLRQGMSALLVISRSAEAASPYHIDVQPGNAKVPRGSDQAVKAKLLGFTTKDATLMVRTEKNGAFDALPLAPGKDPAVFEGLIFHLDKDADYYVEANGVRSPTFSMSVLDLPTVKTLALEYRFPAYTGLEPRTVEPGGDVAALAGTEVRLKVTPTMASNAGKIWLNDTTSLPLTTQGDGTLTGAFTLDKDGFYRIELNGPHNEAVKASQQYTIDVLNDQGPTVKFSKPGRDTQASPVEEVFAEVRADDDFGVKQVQMFYSVNGGAEKTVALFNGAKAQPEVTASHTIYLEELGLKPGDFVSYYAKATDNNAVNGGQTTTSDIYFVQIRPFKKDYTAAASQGGGGGGGGGGDQVGQLSEQERQIVAATFNTVRDKPKNGDKKYKEDTVFLTLSQAKLRAQVEEIAGKMNSRLDSVDPAYAKIAEALPKAAKEMQAAEGNLKNLDAKEALTPEQRALKLLQDAEQEYEVQVQQQRGGGGGGGANSQQAQDLADLFELEMDKLANQYEVQQRADQQSSDKQIDELANKLKEMAKREQQEAERAARMQQAASGGGSSADNQRQLAQQLEDAARQLEQLSRDEPRQNLADAARQLRDAANQMRQAAANGSADGGAAAQAALQKLRDAQQKLTQNQSGRGERDLAQAKRDADQLSADQKDVQQREQQLAGMNATDRANQTRALQQKKDDMDKRLGQLQDDLEKRANDMRGSEKDAARKLDDAAGSITDKRMREKVQYTRGVMSSNTSNASDYVRSVEDSLAGDLDALSKKVGEAQAAVGQQNKQDALARAADKTGDMRRNLESMLNGEQGQQQDSQGSQGSRGSQGSQPGQQGSQGSRGSQGSQQAQNGQGQQGQGQQGQQGQGQQGQQGRGQGQGQGQGNGQGQQANNNGGGNGGGYNNGGYNNGTNYNGGAGPYYGGPRNGMNGNQPIFRMSDEQIRQARRQAQELATDAQDLRKMLAEAGQPAQGFDDIMRAIQDLQKPTVFDDGSNLAALQQAALEKIKKFEFGLRKQVDGGDQPLSLSGADEVPAAYRDKISEYYKSLAKK